MQSSTVTAFYSVGAVGNGTLTLTASSSSLASDQGWYNIQVGTYSVAVTPKGTSEPTRRAGTAGYNAVFTVLNTGTAPDSYSLTCTSSANVTCGSVTPTTLANVAAGASASVTVGYSVGNAGTGQLTLTAASAKASDAGFYTIPIVFQGAPLVDVTPYNYAKQDYGLCAVSCFANVYVQSTVPYFSLDRPRNLTLVYNSDRVNPRPFVHVDVSPDSGDTPTEYRLQVKVNGAFVTFVNGEQTLRFAYPGRVKARLGGQFDRSTDATGVYPMDIVVSAYYASTGALITASLATKLVVVSETNSPVAGGWTLGGIQRVYLQSDSSALVTEGDGSAVYFAKVGGAWVSPAAEFSTLAPSTLSLTSGWARTYPDGTRAVFDNRGWMVQLRDRFDNITSIQYDGTGRVVRIADPANLILTFTYGTYGLASIQDPALRTTTVTVDASRKLTAITDPDNVSTSFIADATLQLLKVIDRRADTTQFSYDMLSRKLTLVTSPPVAILGSATPVSLTERHYPWEHVGVPYTATAITAAAAPLADTVRARVLDSRGFTTVLQVDRLGAIVRIDDALGRTTKLTRDADSRVVRDSFPSGRMVTRTWSGPNPTQLVDNATGRTINYVYETIYNQVTRVYGDVDSLFNYWSAGKLDSTRSSNRPFQRLRYDARGRMVSDSDAVGHVSRFYYGSVGFQNLDSAKTGTRRTAYTYDAFGRAATVTDPANKVTSFQYDALNRGVRTISPLSDTTTFGYDALFSTQVTDARGQVYQFGRNALGWLVTQTDPTGKPDLYSYDENGNVRQWTNRRGQVISWAAYDGLNRPTSVTADAKTKTLAYDVRDRFSVVSSGESTDTVKYDLAGRPTNQISVRGTARYELRSTFNIRDLRDTVQITTPWVTTMRYHYNSNMLLDTLTDLVGGRTVITYNSDLQPNGVTLPTGLGITRSYPSTHTPAEITFSDPAINGALGIKYHYNGLAKVDDRTNGAGSGGRDFIYDALGRLAQCGDYTWQATGCDWYCDDTGCRWQCVSQQKVYSRTQTFTYDRLGNRSDLGAVVAAGNRLVKFNGDSMVYDADGNLVKRIRGGVDVQRLYWNSVGQLVAVWTSGKDSTNFAYDGFGRRVRKWTATATTSLLYDGFELFAEVDGAGNRLAEYTYYPWVDQPHSVRVGGATGSAYYFLQDFPGHVIGMVNSAGALVNSYTYGPWADETTSPGPAPNSLRFAARPYDSETGLVYMRARYYDPQVGRFISEDPIGLQGGINAYAYVANDPVNQTDPSGQECHEEEALLSMSASNSASDGGGKKLVCTNVTGGDIGAIGDYLGGEAGRWASDFLNAALFGGLSARDAYLYASGRFVAPTVYTKPGVFWLDYTDQHGHLYIFELYDATFELVRIKKVHPYGIDAVYNLHGVTGSACHEGACEPGVVLWARWVPIRSTLIELSPGNYAGGFWQNGRAGGFLWHR